MKLIFATIWVFLVRLGYSSLVKHFPSMPNTLEFDPQHCTELGRGKQDPKSQIYDSLYEVPRIARS